MKACAAALAALFVCLAVPALAGAAGFEVDSTGDQQDQTPGNGVCATVAATCTLRAAIEEANDEASADTITFAPLFDGGVGATISPVTALPKVTQPLTIEGGRCTGASGFAGPCVGLAAASGQAGLVLAAPQSTLRGLAIAGATTGITVEGAAAGARIAGSWLGLTLAGTPGANQTGVSVGAAAGVTVGGAAADANRFNGGAVAVSIGPGAQRAAIEGNLIGLDLSGAVTFVPPTAFGVDDDASGQTSAAETARIATNQIAMLQGDAIRQRGGGALIAGNLIGQTAGGLPTAAGDVGIHLDGLHGITSYVEGNTIANSGRYGLLIENTNNRVVGNQIAGAAVNGIRIASTKANPATGNQIGEDAESTENTISGSGGAAIVIIDEPISNNIVARVSGRANGGLFIDRGGDGVGNAGENTLIGRGAYAAIAPPTVDIASRTGASGTTNAAGAVIRVYAKQTASPGELGQMIAETTATTVFSADGAESREWAVTYPSRPLGSYIAVTASSTLYGTSELGIAATDSQPPRAKIVSGPRRRVYKRTVKFRFTSTEARSTFVCKLDRRPWRSCRSPLVYRHLKRGFHTFSVRAKDAAGNVQPRPTVRRFKVLRHKLRLHR
ncbi:MAG TPA: right-handed parallel beta-helix repeat-containing protein [Solirubrobacterales bacterium]|nr:right-handed parallel beta-helix repeat-containing protein [Solirubrobacterales bacterium]